MLVQKGISENGQMLKGGDKRAPQRNSRLTVELARVMQVRERTRVQR